MPASVTKCLTKHLLRLAPAAVSLLGTACSGVDATASGHADAARTIEVHMVDIAFEPAILHADEGETVRFIFTNTGDLPHDAFIGDAQAHRAHEAAMRSRHDGHDPQDEHDDQSKNVVVVAPGETGGLTYTFDEVGILQIVCHQQGHDEAGMKTAIHVT